MGSGLVHLLFLWNATNSVVPLAIDPPGGVWKLATLQGKSELVGAWCGYVVFIQSIKLDKPCPITLTLIMSCGKFKEYLRVDMERLNPKLSAFNCTFGAVGPIPPLFPYSNFRKGSCYFALILFWLRWLTGEVWKCVWFHCTHNHHWTGRHKLILVEAIFCLIIFLGLTVLAWGRR